MAVAFRKQPREKPLSRVAESASPEVKHYSSQLKVRCDSTAPGVVCVPHMAVARVQ